MYFDLSSFEQIVLCLSKDSEYQEAIRISECFNINSEFGEFS